jgi:hypothetical protein
MRAKDHLNVHFLVLMFYSYIGHYDEENWVKDLWDFSVFFF